ncbi:MAG: heparitin sulfate lyase, partial [Muribaculaceae bacterium]|nr:heparitin sulfate lyase [Muribaculaceae bacterium]
MRIIHNTVTGIMVLGFIVSATGCLEDDSIFKSDTGIVVEDEEVIDNASIDIRAFEILDLSHKGLETVKDFYDAGEYYRAGNALLDYYRTRTNVTNAAINLISPTISTTEKNYAERALSINGYNLYVPDFYADANSYAAGNADVIKWDMNPSGDVEELYRINRLAWMAMQGKAYRVSLDETYVTDWVRVYEAWLTSHALPEGITDFNTAAETASDPVVRTALYGWRPYDVAFRLADKCNILYYFMQSVNFTPGMLTKLIANVAEEANHVYNHLDTDDNTRLAKEGYALYRVGYIFPEIKNSAQWLAKGNDFANMDVDTRVFDLLDMNYSGLSKVSAAYNAGDYGLAMEELLSFYRSRTHGRNPSVDIENTTATANEQKWADMALRENGYRFYVNNYYDSSAGTQVPYSYMNADGNGIDWTLRHTGEQEQLYQLHRHQWMLPQAKTYFVTGDEKYAQNWMEVYGDWIENVPKPADNVSVTNHRSWRPLDVAARLIDRCALLEYYQTSPSITAEWIAEVLVRVDEETNHIIRNYSETTNHLITQAQAVT